MTQIKILDKKSTDTEIPNTRNFYAISTFHLRGNVLRKVITTNCPLLLWSCATRDLYKSKLVFSNRRNKKLHDLLVRSWITTPSPDQPWSQTTNICKNTSCRYCTKLYTSGKITSKTTGTMHTITCLGCGTQYVGQTKHRLMDRFQGHYYNISKGIEQIGRHYTSSNHEGIADLRIHILTFIKQSSKSEAGQLAWDKLELTWIHRLCTQAPYKLNVLEWESHSPNCLYSQQDLSHPWRMGYSLKFLTYTAALLKIRMTDLATILHIGLTHMVV